MLLDCKLTSFGVSIYHLSCGIICFYFLSLPLLLWVLLLLNDWNVYPLLCIYWGPTLKHCQFSNYCLWVSCKRRWDWIFFLFVDILLHFTEASKTFYVFIASVISCLVIMSLMLLYLSFFIFISCTNYAYNATR